MEKVLTTYCTLQVYYGLCVNVSLLSLSTSDCSLVSSSAVLEENMYSVMYCDLGTDFTCYGVTRNTC